ncbi:MAG: hypothetical protein U5P10_14210 [Spirochaetia bacterium]|nr:hypothetical protein [Spirochaetia bacterium]
MRKYVTTVALIFFFIGGMATAEGNFGLGAMVGEPSGITGKLYLSNNIAVDATVSWSFISDKLYVHSDYLHHFPGIFGSDIPTLAGYTGIGGMIELKDNPEIGLRIPFGLSFTIPDAPVELFFEIVPMVLLAPETDGALNGGLGARYYF